MADWVQLPDDLWCMVLKELTLSSDKIRFSSVCRSWRSLQKSKTPSPAMELPWVVLCDDNHDDQTRGFFSLSEHKTYRLKLPELVGKRCCGSSHGWLITIDLDLRMHLLHPFSRKQIPLPSPPRFPVEEEDDEEDARLLYTAEQLRDYGLWKAFMFSDPVTSPNDCVVIGIHAEGKLVLYRLGDNHWNMIRDQRGSYFDVIYYKQQIIGLTSMGEVVVISEAGPHSQTTEFPAPQFQGDIKGYLVESMGDLLHVIRIFSAFTDAADGHWCYPTCGFRLLKLDPNTKKWVEVKSLGDRALFLGYGTSMSFSARDYPGCQENAIYFTDDNTDKDLSYGYDDLGVYNLGDGTVKPYYPSDAFHPSLSPPLWFTPRPIINGLAG